MARHKRSRRIARRLGGTLAQGLLTLLRPVLKRTASLGDKLACVVFAVALNQFPLYVNQYTNALSGALTEAGKSYEELNKAASTFGQDIDTFLRNLEASPTQEAHKSAQIHRSALERYTHYKGDLARLQQASMWSKPFVFASCFDWSLHRAVQFRPGLILTAEGGVYALIGIVLESCLAAAAAAAFRRKDRDSASKASPTALPHSSPAPVAH